MKTIHTNRNMTTGRIFIVSWFSFMASGFILVPFIRWYHTLHSVCQHALLSYLYCLEDSQTPQHARVLCAWVCSSSYMLNTKWHVKIGSPFHQDLLYGVFSFERKQYSCFFVCPFVLCGVKEDRKLLSVVIKETDVHYNSSHLTWVFLSLLFQNFTVSHLTWSSLMSPQIRFGLQYSILERSHPVTGCVWP